MCQEQKRREIILQAEKYWEMKRLQQDLEVYKGKKLTTDEYLYLCAFLCNYTNKDLTNLVYKTYKTIRFELSNLYGYINPICQEKLGEERAVKKWFYVVKYLDKLGYRKGEWKLVTTIDINELDKLKVEKILQDALGDSSLSLERIEKGSIILIFSSSQDSFEKARAMYESGELADLLGMPIQDVQLLTTVPAKTAVEQESFANLLLNRLREEGYSWVDLSDISDILQLVQQAYLTTQEAIESAFGELLYPDTDMLGTVTKQGEDDLYNDDLEEDVDQDFLNALAAEVINFYNN